MLTTEHDGGRAACGSGDVDDQEDRGAQQLGDLRSRGAFVVPIAAVEKAHDTFDYCNIGIAARPRESL